MEQILRKIIRESLEELLQEKKKEKTREIHLPELSMNEDKLIDYLKDIYGIELKKKELS